MVGFGSLSKRDLELLVFYLLERDGFLPRDATNHDLARRLSVTPSRARVFRRDADARWGRLDAGADGPGARVPALLKRLLAPGALDAARRHTPAADRSDGFVGLFVRHPADRDLLEQQVVDADGVPRAGRSPDVLLVRFEVLVAVAERNLARAEAGEVRRQLRTLAPAADEVAALLKKNVSDVRWEDVRATLNFVGRQGRRGAGRGVAPEAARGRIPGAAVRRANPRLPFDSAPLRGATLRANQ